MSTELMKTYFGQFERVQKFLFDDICTTRLHAWMRNTASLIDQIYRKTEPNPAHHIPNFHS